MYFYQFLVFLIGIGYIAQAQEFVVPENQEDGVYEAFYLVNGTQVTRKIADLQTNPGELTVDNERHIRAKIHCFQYSVPRPDIASATYSLAANCVNQHRGKVLAHHSKFAVSGDAIVFICNPNDEALVCNKGAIYDGVEYVQKGCRRFRAGSIYGTQGHKGDRLRFAIGYVAIRHRICSGYKNVRPGIAQQMP